MNISRRDFLKGTAAGALGLAASSLLSPVSAFAEGEYGDGLTRLRFTAPGDTVLVTLLDETGNPVLPMSDEGMYLLSPGFYSYYAVDPALGELLVPVTLLPLDGSAAELEIPLGAEAEPSVTTPGEALQEPAADSSAMPRIRSTHQLYSRSFSTSQRYRGFPHICPSSEK